MDDLLRSREILFAKLSELRAKQTTMKREWADRVRVYTEEVRQLELDIEVLANTYEGLKTSLGILRGEKE